METWNETYSEAQNLRNFRKTGYIEKSMWSPEQQRSVSERSGLERDYDDIGASISDWDDIDRHWKTILLGRQVKGLSEEERTDQEPGYEVEDEDEHPPQVEMTGTRLGTHLRPYSVTDIGGEDVSLDEVSQPLPPF
jgi:hypothetical protein